MCSQCLDVNAAENTQISTDVTFITCEVYSKKFLVDFGL